MHDALLYRTEEDLVQEVRQFVEQGQRQNEPVLLAFAGRSLQRLREALGEAGHARFLDIEDLGTNPARMIPTYGQWVQEQEGPVRLAGELLWPGRDPHEATEVIRHEALFDLALGDAGVSTLCAYNASSLPDWLLSAVEETHRGVIEPRSGWRPSHTYSDPLELWENPRRELCEPEQPLELPVTEDLSSLRHQVRDSPVLEPVPRERRSDFLLAISEAAANALRYDCPPRTLRMWRNGHRVVAEVCGQGRIEDPLTGRRRPPARASRGWGLWVINQVCDLVELRQQEERVRLRMSMRCR
ncbi:MAG TPA: anti-sigma factor RsbA family regulatory protein [Solirubrobacteraceae bacterium]|nr:anti-sigma factor RsbA family regulatory protein [Solirubrobacteraceae bacterium]